MKRISPVVNIGTVQIGGGLPPVLQSMTSTDTRDVKKTVAEIQALHTAGAEIVRLAIPDEAAAEAAVKICQQVDPVPVVGDFHFGGAEILKAVPKCAEALAKFRINPGNSTDKHFTDFLKRAKKLKKPVRIGVNAGSVSPEILADSRSLVQAVLRTVELSVLTANSLNFPADQLVLSAKLSSVPETIAVYRSLAQNFPYALHLGLTEAGSGLSGEIASTTAMGTLLAEGIGETFRISLTPKPGKSRTREVDVGKQILQALELRNFAPRIISCPGCGRTQSDQFQRLADEISGRVEKAFPRWQKKFPGVETLKIAVMGCVVNGPGEARSADIGLSLPGGGEASAIVFVRGKKVADLTGENLTGEFWEILETFVAEHFSK